MNGYERGVGVRDAASLAAGIDVISFSFGDAEPYIERIYDGGGCIMQTIGSATEAEVTVIAGVDIVVAQGWEASDHVQSEMVSLPLIPS